MGKGATTLWILLFIVIVLAIAYLYLNKTTVQPSAAASLLVVRLTDPPSAPYGTEGLNMSYSSLQVHVVGSNGSSWVNTGASGTVDLFMLQNFSTVIAKADVPLGSRVDMVRFNISSATVTIHGSSFQMTVPNATVVVPVSGSVATNSSASVLISFSPTVMPVFSNSTASFYLSHSAKGIFLPHSNATAQSNETERLNETVRARIENVSPAISITAASVQAAGNSSSVSVTVKDNSNYSVTLRHVLLSGNETVYVSVPSAAENAMANLSTRQNQEKVPPSFDNVTAEDLLNETFNVVGTALGQLGSNQTKSLTGEAIGRILNSKNASALAEAGGSSSSEIGTALNLSIPGISSLSNNLNQSQSSDLIRGIVGNLSGSDIRNSLSGKNLSELEGELHNLINSGNFSNANLTNIKGLLTHAEAQASANFEQETITRQAQFRYLAFMVQNDSTLSLPFNSEDFGGQDLGYTLNPGQSVTLAFSGRIQIADGHVGISLINGGIYSVKVIGEDSAFASVNVTAG